VTASGQAFDARDRLYLGLRGVALLVGLAYGFESLGPGSVRLATLGALGTFAVYSALLYVVGWRLLGTRAKGTFYVAAAAVDLVFIAVLMRITGGATSPFYRALYLWIAISAFYFGRRAGLLASTLALLVYGGFEVAAGGPGSPWVVGVIVGGLIMHGPLVGWLADRERVRADEIRSQREQLEREREELRRAYRDLEEANRRLREEQTKLVQAEKLSSLGLLASGVAHEINNPLSGVKGCLELLRDGRVAGERRDQYFDTMRDGLERIDAIVKGLLDFSRQRHPAPVSLDVMEVVEACLRLLAPVTRGKELGVDLHIRPGEASIHADRSQVMQAVVNVLMNAAQASPPGGRIEVSARRQNGAVGIRVCDHGPGIARQDLGRVCDPFFTTKPEGEGTGLGLAITLGIVRAHGGDLSIESEEGAGTTVTLWMPAQGAVHA
jgi:signal transduction histidine kinase